MSASEQSRRARDDLDPAAVAEVASWPRLTAEREAEFVRIFRPAMERHRARLAAEARERGGQPD